MGCKIDLNGVEILDVKNATFACFYEKIQGVLNEGDIELTDALRELLESLEQGGYGIGLDIGDYLKTKADYKMFVQIIEAAKNRLFMEFQDLSPEVKNRLDKFCSKLDETTKQK